MTTWRVEAWTHPMDPGGFAVRDAALPILSYQGNDPEEPRGRVSITLPATYDWRSLIAVANPTDPADTSFLRVYREGIPNTETPDVEYVLERFSKRIDDDLGEVVEIFGVDWRLAGLDTTALRWFDWRPGMERSIDPDWSYGLGRTLTTDSGFELDSLPNAGFEDGNTDHWSTPEGGSITAIEDPIQAESGDFYGLWNPSGSDSILRRSITSVRTGASYTVTVFLDDIDGTGERIRVGVNGASTATHTNAYEVDGIWYAEIGNATQGNGSTDGTHQQTTLTFTAAESPVEIILEYLGVNDHNIAVDSLGLSGAEFGIGGWVAGGGSATMNVAEISTEQAHSGTRSLKLQGSQPAYIDAFGRISYISIRAQTADDIPLTPGKLYTAEVWVYHTGGAAEDFTTWASRSSPQGPLAPTIAGGYLPAPGSYWMAGRTESVTPNTWTRLTWTSIADTNAVKLGVAWNGGKTDVGVQSSPTFYVDDFVLVEGLAAQPWGVIANHIIDDANVDHVADVPRLTWLTGRTWTDAADSGGEPWPREESLVLRRGQKYGRHIFGGLGRGLGYEYDITPNTTDPTDPEWDMHIWGDGERGVVHTDIGFHVGVGATGGLVAGRVPRATRWLAEGADGLITEVANVDQETATGVVEDFIGNADLIDSASLSAFAQTTLNEDLANRLAITFELDDSAPVPYQDFNVADRAQFGIPGTMDRHERRVSDIALGAGMGEDGSLLWTPTVTASKLLTGEAATKESIYRLLTAFKRMPDDRPARPSLGEGGGNAPDIVIAAANAPEFVKARADLICVGSNDQLVIEEAASLLPTEGGLIQLTVGTFRFSAPATISTNETAIRGTSYGTEIIAEVAMASMLTVSGQTARVSDIRFIGQGLADKALYLQGAHHSQVTHCIFSGGSQTSIHLEADYCLIAFNEEQAPTPATFVLDNTLHQYNRILANVAFGEINMGDGTDWIVANNSLSAPIIGNGADRVTITGNQWVHSGVITGDTATDGVIDLRNGQHVTITDNHIPDGGGFDGIFLSAITRGVTVEGNQMESVGVGIYVSACESATVTGNSIRWADEHGIHLNATSDALVSDNYIYQPSQNATDTFDGIFLDGDSNRNHMVDNRIVGGGFAPPRWAINVSAATCDDNVYVGNKSGPSADYARNAGATTTPYNDAGTGTLTTWPGAAAPQGDNFL